MKGHCLVKPVHVKLLRKDKTDIFLQNLGRDNTVFVPDKKDGLVTFCEYKRKDFLLFPYSNFYISPAKSFLFPSSIQKYLDASFNDAWMKPGKKALFGIRPCDAHSLVLLDKAVKDNEFYREKRESLILIVQGCNAPRSTCFCTSVNGGPFSVTGADIFITDIGENFVVEDISGRAAEYIASLPDAGSKDLLKKESNAFRANQMIDVRLDFNGMPEKLERMESKLEKEGIWRKLGEKCTNCAQCTSICPTCHCCFVIDDVIEMTSDELGESAKGFDPCMLNIIISSGFSDTDPHPSNRLKRRVMDKFCSTMKTIGQPFCVGCGRCVISCVENIDMIEILQLLTEHDVPEKKSNQGYYQLSQ